MSTRNRDVGIATNPSYSEDKDIAYAKLNSIIREYAMYALNSKMTPKEALTKAAELAWEVIKAESK